jgi:rare lipoprotein A
MMRGGRPLVRAVVLLASCAAVVGCSEANLASYAVKEAASPSQAGPGYKIGKPYQIQGVWYYPAVDYSYAETGIASWYGPDFHGKYTANGEIFDQNEVTAAHRTLPMPSIVRVTNLENGRSLVVRVNDRGPFAHGRIIDLSRRAAQMLGMEQTGTAKVRVEIMAEESRTLAMQLPASPGEAPPAAAAAPRETVVAETLPPPGSREAPKPLVKAPPPPRQTAQAPTAQSLGTQQVKVVPVKPTQMYIQAGAFSRFDNANRLSASLSAIGQTSISQVYTKSGLFFRVRMGPITSVDAADALLEKVISSGYPDARLVVD